MTEAQKELWLSEYSLVNKSLKRLGSKKNMIARVLEQIKAISQVLSDN